MIEYKLQPFHEISVFVAQNIDDHYEDSIDIFTQGHLNIDWDYYLQASVAGQCVAIVAYDGASIVGYSVFTISNNANHKHIMEANNACIYVDKKHRGKVSLQLINKADEFMKALGVDEINYLLKDDRLGEILKRKGYRPDHKLWSVKI